MDSILILLIGRNVKRLRTIQEISQEGLGAKSGLHRTHISLIELGKGSPSMKNLEKIAVALGVPIVELLTEPIR